MRPRRLLLVPALIVGLLVASSPAGARSPARPRPRGGSQACLGHRNSQWVNNDPAQLQAVLNYGVRGQAASTITGGAYSITFVHDGGGNTMNVVARIELALGNTTAHADTIADAQYVLRNHSIVIGSVGQDNTVLTIVTHGVSVPLPPMNGLVFPTGAGQRIPYTCSGSRLRIFPESSLPVTFQRTSLP